MTKKFVLSTTMLIGVCLFASDVKRAEAAHGSRGFGIHIGGRNVHLDIGNPHGYRKYGYGGSYHSQVTRRYYHPSGYHWHPTYYDYIPGYFVPRGSHCDYHYPSHRSGHWDRHHGRHGRHH